MDPELEAMHSGYHALGDALVRSAAMPPPPHPPDAAARRQLLDCLCDVLAEGDKTLRRPALALLWARQHLDILRQLEAHLAARG